MQCYFKKHKKRKYVNNCTCPKKCKSKNNKTKRNKPSILRQMFSLPLLFFLLLLFSLHLFAFFLLCGGLARLFPLFPHGPLFHPHPKVHRLLPIRVHPIQVTKKIGEERQTRKKVPAWLKTLANLHFGQDMQFPNRWEFRHFLHPSFFKGLLKTRLELVSGANF